MIFYDIVLYGSAALSMAAAALVTVLAVRFYRDNSA